MTNYLYLHDIIYEATYLPSVKIYDQPCNLCFPFFALKHSLTYCITSFNTYLLLLEVAIYLTSHRVVWVVEREKVINKLWLWYHNSYLFSSTSWQLMGVAKQSRRLRLCQCSIQMRLIDYLLLRNLPAPGWLPSGHQCINVRCLFPSRWTDSAVMHSTQVLSFFDDGTCRDFNVPCEGWLRSINMCCWAWLFACSFVSFAMEINGLLWWFTKVVYLVFKQNKEVQKLCRSF